MHTSLNHVLLDIVRSQESVWKATARVEWEADPKTPGRRLYRITGASKAVVQHAVDARMREVEDSEGFGNFLGPYRHGDGYLAIGEVTAAQSERVS